MPLRVLQGFIDSLTSHSFVRIAPVSVVVRKQKAMYWLR
ncbi:hypothetical protein HCZ42_11965 [Vibrio hepatarius]|nr:hypothetical protein [Vibrio hepatarius]